MSNYIIRAKNHQEWLQARVGGIGASEIGTILGVNPYETPYQLWLKKTGQVPSVEVENEAMLMGHLLEPAVAERCSKETGLQIIQNSADEFVVINKDKPYLRVSPDRYAWLPNSRHTRDNKVIIECKTTRNEIDAENVPMTWFTQVIYQLGVCEMNQAYLAWLQFGTTFGYKVINFDKDFYNDCIVAEIEKFWFDYVKGGQEPPLTDVQDVLLKYPRQIEGKTVPIGDLMETYNELKETKAEIKRLETIKKEAEDKLKFALQDAESIIMPATADTPTKTLVTWRCGKDREVFDVDAFKAENGELYASYLKTVNGSRTFIVK